MKTLNGKRVLIFQQRGWAIKIGHPVAKELQEGGCKLAALTFKSETHDFVLNQKDVKYDLVINNDEIMGNPKEYLDGDEYSLEEICDDLGIDSIWPIVMSLRNHICSYRDKYYYGFKQNVPDDEIIDYIMAAYKYIKLFFDEFDPEVIISPNFVALPHIMFNLFAMKRGVEMTVVTDCKVAGVYIFSRSFRDDRGRFLDRVDALNKGTVESGNIDKAKKYIEEFRDEFKKPDYASDEKISTVTRIKKEIAPYYNVFRWFIRWCLRQPNSMLESTGITLDCRTPKFILRDHFAGKRYKRVVKKFDYYPFEQVRKFVYLPLQFQPEESIDVAAPFSSNQIETARQIAMSLPGDHTLVVKEHPGMIGLRPPSYLEKIARTPNIKLVDHRIPNQEILERVDLVVSPNSTTIAEAAFFSKPAIQLGNLGTTLKFPNVSRHTDMQTLSKKIKEMLATNLKTEEYERKLENYVAAVYDVGFELNYTKLWNGDPSDFVKFIKALKEELVDAVSSS